MATSSKRPILYCAIAFSAGIATGYFFNIPIIAALISSTILIALAVVFLRNNILSHIFLYLALIVFAAAYYQNYNILPANHVSLFASEEGEKVLLKGRIEDDPVISDAFYGKKRTTFTIQSEGLGLLRRPALGGAPRNDGTAPFGDSPCFLVSGLVKASLYTDEEIKNLGFGEEVIIEGILSKPKALRNPGLFDYSKYLKIKNIYAVFTASRNESINILRGEEGAGYFLWDKKIQGKSSLSPFRKWAYAARSRINNAIMRYVDKPYSGFLKAILTGERNELEPSIMDDFIKTGTVHVIAISGLNIALIAGIFIFILRIFRIKKRFNLILTSVFLFFYCFVAGANPPVIRATIMFAITSLGYLINRKSDILNSLAIAAFIILLGNPNELFDISFQLSFVSIFGIVLFSPRIESLCGIKPNYFIKAVAISISAIIAVSPIVGRYFNIFSPIAVIANLVIVPALFVITSASFIFLFFDLLGVKFILIYAGYTLSLLTQATFYINHLFAQMPLSYFRVPSPPLSLLLLYYLFIFSFFFLKRKKELFIILLLAMNAVVWGNIPLARAKELKVTFLDVGRGDSALIEFPNKTTLLIDAGSGGMEGFTDMGRSIVAPYLWNKGIKRIDAIIGTHFHEDHMGGLLYILKNFDTGCMMDSGISDSSNIRLYDNYRKIILRQNIRRLAIAAGYEILGFGDARIFVINPPEEHREWDANDSSVTIKLEYKNFSMLLCGDISYKAMEYLLKYDGFLKSDILKIPHHGGSTGKDISAKIFFEKVSPRVSIISSGATSHAKNLPAEIFYADSTIYDTKASGAIELITDGSTFKVERFCVK